MFYIKKTPGDLTVYVVNRVRQIQDYGIPIFFVDSFNNPSDNVSKVKNVKQYLNTSLWDYGPPYMSDPKWYVGRSIEEIREVKSPNPSLSEEISKEVRKSPQEVHINLTQMIQTPTTQNIISFVQEKTNDLTKIKRLLLYCFKYLASILPSKFSSSNPKPLTLLGEGSLQENSVFKNSKNPEIPAQFYWTPYQRRWYVAKKAEIKEIPSKLENKPHVGQTVVRFLCDKTFSLVSTSKLEPIGQDEVDKKRAKGYAKGYAEMETILKAKSTKPQDISEIGEDEIAIRDG